MASKKVPFENQKPVIFVTHTPEQQERVDAHLAKSLRSAASAAAASGRPVINAQRGSEAK